MATVSHFRTTGMLRALGHKLAGRPSSPQCVSTSPRPHQDEIVAVGVRVDLDGDGDGDGDDRDGSSMTRIDHAREDRR